tara:strand:+ start:3582 stop:4274 length:693 start_codon:yes stop_codon:yes gene_type:complete
MIHATQKENFTVYVTTKENRINTSASNWNHLFKFTNDMTGDTIYSYATTETITDRYTKCDFTYHATPNTLTGRINLTPAGYWKYEVYEISWQENIQLDGEHAPMTENSVLPDETQYGLVSGLVEIGKLYVEEETGEEQVQYVQHSNYVVELTIDYAGFGYTSPPTISIESGSISQATATCTILGGEINTVTLTNKGGGYTSNPKVTLTGGGFGKEAQISANIYEKNYIYY